MPSARFFIINIIAGIIWAIPVGLLGFYAGHAAEFAFSGVQHYQWWIIAALLALATIVLLVRHLHHTEWVEDLKSVDLHTPVPLLIGFMGFINIVSAILPR